jgi:tricarballylate dehydrogenase
MRFAYEDADQVMTLIPDWHSNRIVTVGEYPPAAFHRDLMRLTDGRSDPVLADTLVNRSFSTMSWLRDQGLRFEFHWAHAYQEDISEATGSETGLSIGTTPEPASSTAYHFTAGECLKAEGGGQGLSDQLFDIAERIGVEIRYSSKASRLLQDGDGSVAGVVVDNGKGKRSLRASAVVLASGGFEASSAMREQYLGPQWKDARVRGSLHNTGDGIQMALDIGAQPYGDWKGCHAVAWDIGAPLTGDRRVRGGYTKGSHPFGLLVNKLGLRFVDEGEDLRHYTYAKHGGHILNQPGGEAYQIFDEKAMPLLRTSYHLPEATMVQAETIPELAELLEVDRDAFVRTISEYNAACQQGTFDPSRLDGVGTTGIDPPKSNWALPLDEPPYRAFHVTCGITFTYGGLRISPAAQVMSTSGETVKGLFAAGELVGGLFYGNYPSGSGLMAGAVFGRIAGESAAGYHGPGQ